MRYVQVLFGCKVM